MFGRKKDPNKKESKKEQNPREMATNRIIEELEQLHPEQRLVYKIPEFFWDGPAGGFAIAELNPRYPAKGKKYTFYNDKLANGKPAGKPGPKYQDNNPKSVAQWIAAYNYRGTIERFDKAGELEIA